MVSKRSLDMPVKQIKPTRTWEQVAAARSTVGALQQLAGSAGGRKNAVAVFAGASGRESLAAAEAVARELNLELMRVDLSAVFGKYIGETEKNLTRVFDAAEKANAVLLLDEADALFGKRSEVKDSHDRYANLEAQYLLQRMESHQGLTIVATSRKTNIDDAFLRRIHSVIHFNVE